MGTRLLGAMEILLEEMGIRLENEERLSYERAVDTARRQLGDEVFSRAWQEGRAMSTEQATKYAIR
jgi:hypothetical protein